MKYNINNLYFAKCRHFIMDIVNVSDENGQIMSPHPDYVDYYTVLLLRDNKYVNIYNKSIKYKDISQLDNNQEQYVEDSKIDMERLKGRKVVYTNTTTISGIDSLKDKISEMFNLDKIKQSDYTYITNTRQIAKIKECLLRIEDIDTSLNNMMPLDMIEIDLRDIWNILGEIIGESYTEELLDELFSKFCVGK